jgi:hypothetical protein
MLVNILLQDGRTNYIEGVLRKFQIPDEPTHTTRLRLLAFQ